MSNSNNPDVTKAMVAALWEHALAPAADLEAVHRQAESLLSRVSSESPPVNWGLTALHALTRPGRRDAEPALEHARWLAEMTRYETDPRAWMRGYFSDAVTSFAEARGPVRARKFAANLVRNGHLAMSDLPPHLRS